jgi:hypothetical protein
MHHTKHWHGIGFDRYIATHKKIKIKTVDIAPKIIIHISSIIAIRKAEVLFSISVMLQNSLTF